MSKVVELAVKQPLILRVQDKEFTVEFPLSAVIEAERKVGHSLRTPADWYAAPAKDVPALLEAGLERHHGDLSADERVEVVQNICEQVGPEGLNEIVEALGALAFPRWTERLQEQLKKVEAGKSPNV